MQPIYATRINKYTVKNPIIRTVTDVHSRFYEINKLYIKSCVYRYCGHLYE